MRTMPRSHKGLSANLSLSMSFMLLCAFVACLWLAGGSSRADVSGQAVVRAIAWTVLVAMLLFAPRSLVQAPLLRGPVAWLLGGCVALALVQLVPLPPAIWQALPGRAVLAEAATLTGQTQPWRPWAIVPSATANAAGSLIVPVTMLVLIAGLRAKERPWLVGLLLILVSASTFVGLLQFSGAGGDNPLINGTSGEVSGSFANRNHFALFVAFGCLLAPVWAFAGEHRSRGDDQGRDRSRGPEWRGPMAIGLVLLFALTILASGSRAGMGLGLLGLGVGLLLVQRGIRRTLRNYPRWAFPVLIAAILALVAILVLVSIAADRAVSIERAMTVSAERDMRSRGLPTVWGMVRDYFPWGTGLGGFDPVFRMHEPLSLLKLTYFNHAHNDLIEIVLDAGLPGLVLLAIALVWWATASLRAWRAGPGMEHVLPKLGSAMLLFVILASGFDYPARTPMMMGAIVLAAAWLAGAGEKRSPGHIE